MFTQEPTLYHKLGTAINAAVTTISSIPPSDEPREIFPNGNGTGVSNKPNVYWAHIAFYHLIELEQMPRWQMFVFRCDKAFKAMTALASINGECNVIGFW